MIFFLQEKIVAPHRKHDYDTVCNAKPEQKPTGSKIFQTFQWLSSLGKGDKYPKDEF
jgi:multiple inositol-polyphosphate phosphatase/2,3-bisphosphoglycerate 3-phosphatase